MPGILPRVSSSFNDRAMQHSGLAINSRSAMRPEREEEEKTLGGAIQAAAGGAIGGGAIGAALAGGGEGAKTGTWYGVGGGILVGLASYYL